MINGYDRISFLITDGILVIDCDHYRSGKDVLTPTVFEIVNMFPDSYMEWSPSGSGLHIIGYAPEIRFDKQKYWMNNRTLTIEVHIPGATNRFITLTGNMFRSGSLPDRTTDLQRFLERFMRRDSDSPDVPNTGNESNLDDDTVISPKLPMPEKAPYVKASFG
ncbi:hypothetical protein [Ethanoligenens sp.]|uniref:hypothetical protein n=1 Tax=Ethanoligenens sp. TaxID=2099655 RepID=UPI0039E832CE